MVYRELDEKYGAPNYKPLPVILTRAQGAYCWDIGGCRYVDMMSAYSAVSVGHAHPRILNALNVQAAKLAVPSRAFLNNVLPFFFKGLCKVTGLDGVIPMNSGAEAVETAIKAARRWGYVSKQIPSGMAEIIVANNNFHGRTITITGFSSEQAYRDGFGPFTPGFVSVPFDDAAAVERAINQHTCAVLVEPIQGEAGIIVPQNGYLRKLRDICTENRVLLLVDEIQSGFGRTGKWFGFEHDGILPDGIMVGKALGGGVLPVSAFVAQRRVLDVFASGSHGSTFGGNPLAAAVALEAMSIIEDEGLVQRSAKLGAYMMNRLTAIQNPVVGGVRGRGLWAGVEINPKYASAREVCERLLNKGVLSKETHETVVRLAPPLMIPQEDLDYAIDQLETVLKEIHNGSR